MTGIEKNLIAEIKWLAKQADREQSQARQEVAEEVAWYVTGHVIAPIVVRAERAEAEVELLRLAGNALLLLGPCDVCYEEGCGLADCSCNCHKLDAEAKVAWLAAVAGLPENEGK